MKSYGKMGEAIKRANGNGMLNVDVNGKLYRMKRTMALSILSMAKQNYKKLKKHAIVGLEKDGILLLKNDVYESYDVMKQVINEYYKIGCEVHYYHHRTKKG